MAGSRPGAGHMAGVQNNQMGLGQQRALLYDKQPIERISPNTNNNVAEKFRTVIQDNEKLQEEIKQITELSHEKLMETKKKLSKAKLENEKLNAELEEYTVKLVNALQDYENAKVVVLTYKTRNIHLEAAALELEHKTAEVEKLTKEIESLRKTNMKNVELSENLRYAEDMANKAQQEINQLQLTLRTRTEQIDKLNMVMRSIGEQSQLLPDRLQWMMDEAWRQQQRSQQSVLQECDQLKATVHEKDMLVSQLQHQINELENKKNEAETFRRIKGKNMSTEKIESLAAKLDNATMCIDRKEKDIEVYKAEIKKKDTAIKGLQEILKKEQQSHQDKLAIQGDHNAQNQLKVHELTQMNEKMRTKIEELNQKCEKAEMDYAILKSVDLNAREELQKYKEKVISLEHDIRRNKQIETDLYKELDGALKDLEDVSKRYRSLQNENSELRRGQPAVAFSGMDDSQLVQEINHKNHQVEILHGEIKRYADSLEKERRRVSMLSMENQAYQRQIHKLQEPPPVPPRSPNYSVVNKTQPVVNTHHRAAWEGGSPAIVLSRDVGPSQIMPEHITVEPNYYSERYMQYEPNTGRGQYQFKSHPQDRARTTPHFSSENYSEAYKEPYGEPRGRSEPCPLCNKTFATTEELTLHAARCNAHK